MNESTQPILKLFSMAFRGAFCVIVLCLGIHLCTKMSELMRPVKTVETESLFRPEQRFQFDTRMLGTGQWELSENSNSSQLQIVDEDQARNCLERMLIEHGNIEIAQSVVGDIGNPIARTKPSIERTELENGQSIFTSYGLGNLTATFEMSSRKVSIAAMSLGNGKVFVTANVASPGQTAGSARLTGVKAGLGIGLPSGAEVVASRKTSDQNECLQIVTVPQLDEEKVVKNWESQGWEVARNPLANQNVFDVICVKGNSAVRAWKIGELERQPVLVLTLSTD